MRDYTTALTPKTSSTSCSPTIICCSAYSIRSVANHSWQAELKQCQIYDETQLRTHRIVTVHFTYKLFRTVKPRHSLVRLPALLTAQNKIKTPDNVKGKGKKGKRSQLLLSTFTKCIFDWLCSCLTWGWYRATCGWGSSWRRNGRARRGDWHSGGCYSWGTHGGCVEAHGQTADGAKAGGGWNCGRAHRGGLRGP